MRFLAQFQILLLAVAFSQPSLSPCSAQEDRAETVVDRYYIALQKKKGYQDSRRLALELIAAGKAADEDSLRVRGLVREAYAEIRFGSWGNRWTDKLAKSEELCTSVGTLEHAELLMFRGHLNGKWRRKLTDGVVDLQAAVLIATQLENDKLLAEAHNRLSELFLIEGAITSCISHALLGLRISESSKHEPGIRSALDLVTRAYSTERRPKLALPFAQRLLEIDPTSEIAAACVARCQAPGDYVTKLRTKIARIDPQTISNLNHNRLGFMHLNLAECLWDMGEREEAYSNYQQAAEHYKRAGNIADYISTTLQASSVPIQDGLTTSQKELFLRMVEDPDSSPSQDQIGEIVRILDSIDLPILAAEWKKKHRDARTHTLERELTTASTIANTYWNLELNKRRLADDVRREEYLLWALSTLAVSFVAILVVGHIVANRRAISTLKQEIRRREEAQAQQQRLSSQLQQTQKLDAIGTLAAGVAHDFGNSLQAILSLSSAAKTECNLESMVHRHLEEIHNVATESRALTQGLTVFSGNQQTHKEPTELRRFLLELSELVSHLLPDSIHVCYDSKSVDSNEMFSSINKSQMKQAVLNMVINARDAMPTGGELSLRVGVDPADPNFAILSISDNGAGMSEEVKKRVFEPFYTTKQRGKGTGLGLAMVHGIIEQHGGQISIDSAPGTGTTIQVSLPMCETPEQIETSSTNLQRRVDDRHALLTEDNEHVRAMVRHQLERRGYRVSEAFDGPSALKAYGAMRNEPTVLIMDIELPGTDGRECLKLLRAEGATAPVIFMSGLPAEEIAAEHILTKPFVDSELESALASVESSS